MNPGTARQVSASLSQRVLSTLSAEGVTATEPWGWDFKRKQKTFPRFKQQKAQLGETFA